MDDEHLCPRQAANGPGPGEQLGPVQATRGKSERGRVALDISIC